VLLSRFLCLSSVSCAKSSAAARQLQPLLPSDVCVLHKHMRSGMWQQRQLIGNSPDEKQQGKFVDRGVEGRRS